MSEITDEMVEAAVEAICAAQELNPVQWWPPRDVLRAALEAALAVRDSRIRGGTQSAPHEPETRADTGCEAGSQVAVRRPQSAALRALVDADDARRAAAVDPATPCAVGGARYRRGARHGRARLSP